MSKIKSLISIFALIGLLMASCGKEIIYIEKEPDGSGYENLDPAVRALIDDFGNRTWPYYVESVRYDNHSRIVPANGITINITISGTEAPWVIRAVEIYPTEGGSEIKLADAVSNNLKTDITFPANLKNDIVVWELQIKPHDGTEWSFFSFYVQLCNDDEMAYEIDGMTNNTVSGDEEYTNIRLTKQNVMETEDDLIWLTVYEEGSSESIDSQPYNLAMMGAGAYATLKIDVNESCEQIRNLHIYYHLQNESAKNYLGSFIQRPRQSIVTGAKLVDRTYIDAVSNEHIIELTVDSNWEKPIRIKIAPHRHAAYGETFEAIEATAYKMHPNYPELNDWKIRVTMPAARGLDFGPGDVAGGWHANFMNDLKAGINGAGFWELSYNTGSLWVFVETFMQEAYFLGIRNPVAGTFRDAFEWIVDSQGEWPDGAVKIRAAYLDGAEYTPEVIVNRIGPYRNSWEAAPPMMIPENDTGGSREWSFQYYIDEIGEWKTWEKWITPGTPEHGWEGKGNHLRQSKL